jgi:hypothetical protein
MALKVIGAGMGRTGTLALKIALERLGFGPCYHGSDLVSNPGHWSFWQRVIDGEVDDFDSIFANYAAVTDAPGWYFFRQLANRYVDAKVILTVRDVNAWFESTQATVLSDATGTLLASAPKALFSIVHTMFLRSAGSKMHDRAHMIAWFERHNDEVRQTIDAERLLTFQVTQGWEPLCRFLGVSVPSEPFPRANDRESAMGSIRTRLSDLG